MLTKVSVAETPGVSEFTVMPIAPSSAAMTRVMDPSAPLEVPYALTIAKPRTAEGERMLMIRPQLC